jgi:hypothetical protein
MQREYVRKFEGAYRIGDTRVSLDSLVYLFREGMPAESMEAYPVWRRVIARAIETNECATDCEAAARASCESDTRLMPAWTDVFSGACGEWRRNRY